MSGSHPTAAPRGGGYVSLGQGCLESVDILAQPTFESSSPVMHPTTSVLFANTNRLAPESRFPGLSATSACPAKGQPDAHLLLQKAMQLLPAIVDAQPVCGIHHPDQGVCLLKVVAPVRPQRLLASDIPCVPGQSRNLRSEGKPTNVEFVPGEQSEPQKGGRAGGQEMPTRRSRWS